MPAPTATARRRACARSALSCSSAERTVRSAARPTGIERSGPAASEDHQRQAGNRTEREPGQPLAERGGGGETGEDHEDRGGREAQQRAARSGRPEEGPGRDPGEGEQDQARVALARGTGEGERGRSSEHGERAPPQPRPQIGAGHAQGGVQPADRGREPGRGLVDRQPDRERPDRGQCARQAGAPIDVVAPRCETPPAPGPKRRTSSPSCRISAARLRRVRERGPGGGGDADSG